MDKRQVLGVLINFLLGFLLPWSTAAFLYKKASLLFFTIVPFTALISVIGNQLGVQLTLFHLNPYDTLPIFNTIFVNLGYNPIAAAWFIYSLYYLKMKRWQVYLAFILLLNSLEFLGLVIGKVSYGTYWNGLYTFLIYGLGLLLLDGFFFKLKQNLPKF